MADGQKSDSIVWSALPLTKLINLPTNITRSINGSLPGRVFLCNCKTEILMHLFYTPFLWRTISNHTLLHDLLYTHTLQTCKCSWLVCVTPGWFYIDLHHLTLGNDSLAEQVWWQSHNTRTLTTDWNRTRWFASLLYVCVRYDTEIHVCLLKWIVVVCV